MSSLRPEGKGATTRTVRQLEAAKHDWNNALMGVEFAAQQYREGRVDEAVSMLDAAMYLMRMPFSLTVFRQLFEERGSAAPEWLPMSSAPTDGTYVDLLFDPETAEPGMTEFYCPEYSVTGVPRIASCFFDEKKASWRPSGGLGYSIISVTLVGWRPLPGLPRSLPELAALARQPLRG